MNPVKKGLYGLLAVVGTLVGIVLTVAVYVLSIAIPVAIVLLVLRLFGVV